MTFDKRKHIAQESELSIEQSQHLFTLISSNFCHSSNFKRMTVKPFANIMKHELIAINHVDVKYTRVITSAFVLNNCVSIYEDTLEKMTQRFLYNWIVGK